MEEEKEREYLAVDIGASSGRHLLGRLHEGRLELKEVYRFPNGLVRKDGQLCWDSEALFREIREGLKKCCELGRMPVSMAIDTWGVDFALIGRDGKLVGDTVGYRDGRTAGMDLAVEEKISEQELYERNGIQKQPYNTLYQLMALRSHHPEQLDGADRLLMTPDYYNYLLTGIMKSEYTIASTSQMTLPETGQWDMELIREMDFPEKLFGKLELPGTLVGPLTEEIQKETGCRTQVLLVGSHDTASAVLAVPAKESPFLYISSGTWSLLGTERSAPEKSEAARKAGLTNEGGYGGTIRFLKNIMGLWMIQSVKKELPQEYSYSELCRMAEESGFRCILDVNDESFLAPESMMEAIRKYAREHGQPVPETPGEFAAAIYQSLAVSYAAAIRELEELEGICYQGIHIVGGGSNADYLNQLTADAAGKTVYAGPVEATAIGNILAQMLANHEFRNITQARETVARSFEMKKFLPRGIAKSL